MGGGGELVSNSVLVRPPVVVLFTAAGVQYQQCTRLEFAWLSEVVDCSPASGEILKIRNDFLLLAGGLCSRAPPDQVISELGEISVDCSSVVPSVDLAKF